MAIGAAMGRMEAHSDKHACYDATRGLHEQFVRRFGSSLCKDLNRGPSRSWRNTPRCRSITLETVRMAYRILNRG